MINWFPNFVVWQKCAYLHLLHIPFLKLGKTRSRTPIKGAQYICDQYWLYFSLILPYAIHVVLIKTFFNLDFFYCNLPLRLLLKINSLHGIFKGKKDHSLCIVTSTSFCPCSPSSSLLHIVTSMVPRFLSWKLSQCILKWSRMHFTGCQQQKYNLSSVSILQSLSLNFTVASIFMVKSWTCLFYLRVATHGAWISSGLHSYSVEVTFSRRKFKVDGFFCLWNYLSCYHSFHLFTIVYCLKYFLYHVLFEET